jgi:hypothetical protein
MTLTVEDMLQVVFPSFAGGAFVIFLAKNWFLERLRGSIKSEYNRELEQLKAELSSKNSREIEEVKALLARDAAMISAVQKFFGESHISSHPQRVEAIQELWESLLHVQRNSPPVFTFLDVLRPNEFGEMLGSKQLKTFSDISTDDIQKMLSGKAMQAENHRLLTGDYLWSLFWAYQALSARTAMLFQTGRAKQNVDAWYNDCGCKSIVQSVCTPAEFTEFESQEFGKIAWIRNLIVSKFMRSANRILCGQSSTDTALEEAQRIVSAVSSANRIRS